MKATRGREERERERERGERESTQRLRRSEGDTIENNDNENGRGVTPGMWGGPDAHSHAHHLKDTFIPHIKAKSRDTTS